MNSTFDAFSLPTPTARYEGRLGAGMGDAVSILWSFNHFVLNPLDRPTV